MTGKKATKAERTLWVGCGMILGIGSVSLALGAVPSPGKITDDTAIYQNLSEIRVAKQRDLNFDSDIARLASLERRYQENLPAAGHPRVRGPVQRIGQRPYRPTLKKINHVKKAERR